MAEKVYELETQVPFSESLVWQLNRDYYQKVGIDAWRKQEVPHHLTSNSMVGKTYASLILGFLKDLRAKDKNEKVYILELGAGHGRLGFHILQHLEQLLEDINLDLPSYCYILSDIVEDNLSFFIDHSQFANYLEQGKLDVAYVDGLNMESIELRFSKEEITSNSLEQPMIVIGNYFFDSIPTDLFFLKNTQLFECEITLRTSENPEQLGSKQLLKIVEPSYNKQLVEGAFFENEISNELLKEYKESLLNTFLFFPENSMRCIENLRKLSKQGLLLLSLDKGFQSLHDLENKQAPELIIHGSFSIWVNFHALGRFCEKMGGKAVFPSYANFHLELACLLFLEDSETYVETLDAYRQNVDDYGPDDFNSLKKYTYNNMMDMSISELLAMQRLSAYDSTFFINTLPRFKQITNKVTFNERHRIAQTMERTWDMYFSLNEAFDLAYEIGGIYYDLGYYKEALQFFNNSINLSGEKPDTVYNKALCFYQLREDALFLETLKSGTESFPDYVRFMDLARLDLNA